jgi:hypothetical protein
LKIKKGDPMQTNTVAVSIVKGLAFSTILEYKEDGKRVFTDYTGYTFKAQFRTAKTSTATLLATVVPVKVGLGQLKLTLTENQTSLFIGTAAYYDILADDGSGLPDRMYEGTVGITEAVSQWENTPPVTTPSVAGGLFKVDQTITLNVNEVGAATYVTTNGSTPTAIDTLLYSTPILLTTTTTLKYFSVDTAGNAETVKTSTYTIDKVAPVTICNQSTDGSITALTDITLNANEPATTYYTTNGAAPSTSSTQYTGAFQLAAGTYAIKFFSVDTAGNVEAVKTVNNLLVV